MKRMTINFIVLFSLFFFLGAVIDITVNLDEFSKISSDSMNEVGFVSRVISFINNAIWFEGPRLFQVYAYLHGVIAIGAMGFTAANMLRSREFVAIMAAGISLRRVAMPFLYVMAGISFLALLNQEFVLPRVAPLLLRDHGESSFKTVGSFPVPFTQDKKGSLLLASLLNPDTEVITEPSFLERDGIGRMVRQVQATRATWNEGPPSGWVLEEGKATNISIDEITGEAKIDVPVAAEFYETELSPRLLTLHRYGQFVGMLSMSQLNNMLQEAGSFDKPLLKRHWYARFASIALNLLAMIIIIPCFVTKDSIIISRHAVSSGAIALAILFGGTVFMLMPIEGIPALVSVFIPAIVLIPVALFRTLTIRT
jgi:lipopolysaccharide export LptBFGC system permease protein LptF